MTCREFKRMFNEVSPLNCTRAERSAFRHHRNTCEECGEWYRIQANRTNASMTPTERLIIRAQMLPTIVADVQDPEFIG